MSMKSHVLVGALLLAALPAFAGEPSAVTTTPERLRAALRQRQGLNFVRSKANANVSYSGVLVQAVRSNPLQLINPFAPAQYGDAEANTSRDIVSGQVTGINLLTVGF